MDSEFWSIILIKSYRGTYNNRKQKNDVIDSIIIADYLRVFGSKDSKLT